MRGVSTKMVVELKGFYARRIGSQIDCDADFLKAGIDHTQLSSKLVAWEAFHKLMSIMHDRFSDQGGVDVFIQEFVLDGMGDSVVKNLSSLVISLPSLLRLISSFIGPRVFKGVQSVLDFGVSGRIKMRFVVDKDLPDSRIFLKCCHAGILAFPEKIGLGRSILISENILSHNSTIEFEPPPSRTIFSRLVGFLKSFRRDIFFSEFQKQIYDFDQRSERLLRDNLSLEAKLHETQKKALLGEMTQTINHEIGNPLTVISSNIQILKDTLGKSKLQPEVYDEYIKASLKACDHLSGIVESIAGFSSRVNTVVTVDVNELFFDVMTFCQPRASREKVKLISLFQKSKPGKISGIKHELIQILCNLVLNAIEASASAGTNEVILDVKKKPRSVDVDFTVEDHGNGVSSENVDLIFQPFVSFKNGGTGLGLSFSRKLAENNLGSVELLSPCHPTIFTFRTKQLF